MKFVESHVHNFRLFFLSTPVSMPCEHLLSNCCGIVPYGWPISFAVWRIDSASLALM